MGNVKSFGLPIWPVMLMVASFTIYQLCLKYVRPGLNVLGFQTVAYFVAGVGAAALWASNPQLGDNAMRPSDLALAVAFAASVIGLEYGYVIAYRSGWPVDMTPALVTGATTIMLMLLAIGLLGEVLTLCKAVGVTLCIAGIALINRTA
jgi:multidrug transporter EmrE-like cation transporter